MPVGFGKTTESTDQYISNFLKQRHNRIDPFFEQEHWYKEYSSRKYSYSISELLEPKYESLEVKINPEWEWVRESHKHLIVKVAGKNGLWGMDVIWDPRHKFWDITITVSAGEGMRFHPDVIEEDITQKYGQVIYKQWQAMVMNDLDSLKTLVKEVRDRIDFVAPSVVCCDRSARLWRGVGIPVKGQFAFLFPSSYSL